MNQKFYKLHDQDRVSWFNQFTLFEFSIFVFWRTHIVDEKSVRKSRILIDIRDLNKISIKNSYSLSLQADVISTIKNCYFITVIDAASFFY